MILNKPVVNKLTNLVASLGLGLAVMMTLTTTVSAQQYKKITRLGTSQSVCTGGVETAEQLQAYFANNPDVIRTILSDSGWSGDAEALLRAVANGDMTETSFPAGTKLAWMGSKKNGKYVALPYREWAGAEPFEGFALNLKSDCRVYEMAIPKACCNVSLISVREDNTGECAPAPVAVPPTPAPEPAPEAAPVVAAEPAKSLALIPFIGAFVGTETVPRFEVSWQQDVVDDSGLIGLKTGVIKPLNTKTSLVGTLSYFNRTSINDGNIFSEDNLALDVGIERQLSDYAFIGGGVGAWNLDDSDFREASLYGIIGGEIGKSNVQWFIEGRVFDSDSEQFDAISDNKAFSFGLRYLIK